MNIKNKWELKSHSWQIADTGDYDGYYEITNGIISIGTKDDGEEIIPQLESAVAFLNKWDIDFFDCKVDDLSIDNHLLKQENEQLRNENEKSREALKIIQNWQLPSTGKFWNNEQTRPMSYGACYGSNGERDYMKSIANDALNHKPIINDTTNG